MFTCYCESWSQEGSVGTLWPLETTSLPYNVSFAGFRGRLLLNHNTVKIMLHTGLRYTSCFQEKFLAINVSLKLLNELSIAVVKM